MKLSKFINLYGCQIGDETKIGAFVEIQKNAQRGAPLQDLKPHVRLRGRDDRRQRLHRPRRDVHQRFLPARDHATDGQLQTEKDWRVETTVVKRGASIGSGATILSKVVIGENAIVGAGSVVTRDVPPNVIVAGNPARVLRSITSPSQGERMTQNVKIPFVDLVTLHQELQAELLGGV